MQIVNSDTSLYERTAEKHGMQNLFAFNLSILAVRTRKDLPAAIHQLRNHIRFHTLSIALMNEDNQSYSIFNFRKEEEAANIRHSVEDGFFAIIADTDCPFILDRQEWERCNKGPDGFRFFADNKVKRIAGMSLTVGKSRVDKSRKGALVLTAENESDFSELEPGLMENVAAQFSAALTNIRENERLLEEINRYKHQLVAESLYLQEEIQSIQNYGEIIGASAAMRKVFQLVSLVSETESTALLMGETGTGKELIARAIHNGSLRKDKLMVKVNCATLPANLIESELFGHEKGSFTGATDRRIGKFELANKSTLFLDEVGELPLDLQVKLLRALQEKEIERIGGRSTIKTDVRIIAATNRNLQKEVQMGRFRSDLYFRLNVFPITIPALRDRKDDIPVLAAHFLVKHAKKNAEGPMHFSNRAIKELSAYSWPGNVRELEHLVERSILLNTGPGISELHLPLAENEVTDALSPGSRVKTINEIEREHIIAVLKMCGGKVAGIGGAAEALKIPSTTLNSKIRRLEIKKGFV
jgi:formate hydrogenlyase transcriptional activator